MQKQRVIPSLTLMLQIGFKDTCACRIQTFSFHCHRSISFHLRSIV